MTPLHANTAAEQPLADYDVLAEYMAGRLSDIETKRFEKRLIDDPQLFRRMAPFLSVLYPVEPTPIELEVRARVAAHRAAKRRAKEAREARRRRLKGWVVVVTTAAVPVKILAGFATASLIYAVARLELPSVAEPPRQIFVQVRPPVPHDSVPRVVAQSEPAHTDHHTVRTHHVPVTDAGQPIDVVPLPAPVDSATERAVAEMVARSLPEGRVTPSATRPGEAGPQVAWVPHIWVEVDTTHSVAREIKDKVVNGLRGALAAITYPIHAIRRRAHHDPQL
jgi:hypothetical protein